MNCANEYCLYNKGCKCTLESISIDSLGHCDDCIIVELDENIVEAEKERQLNKMNQR